ncbi:Undecaprenyl-diphosphatase [Richelia intracellularis HH01]|uniref:Undecaprenyl-diphosphatase n=1 Tax=Richelia intracellularis HH01 TaxID=1165094 RepID=M1WQK0_9NOST|nr:undecaprenyl-diphosphate phosphatase [Richelia intracellularis]CCH66429.1 Undecaprenyl-diphosphatase [Richelia intracellularis HH01]
MVLSKSQLFLFLTVTSVILSLAVTMPTPVLSQVNETASTPQINFWQGAFLGFVQGATEFLPISSTAHLKVVPVIMGWGDPGITFTAVIQLGSIVAVVSYFWVFLLEVITGARKALSCSDYQDNNLRIVIGIIIGNLPIVFFGLLVKYFFSQFYNSNLRSMAVIATTSIFMSLLMGLAEKIGEQKRNLCELSINDGILVGLAQALALIPGSSRSGLTLTGGLLIGLTRETAARFSFLLGIPAITLAGLVELKDLLTTGIGNMGITTVLAGVISSAIFSYLAIDWLLRFLQTTSIWVFVWYRLVFGLVLLGMIGMQ